MKLIKANTHQTDISIRPCPFCGEKEEMTIFCNKVKDHEKPWSFIEDSKENILKDLERYTLDPVFEQYGNFVYTPQWEGGIAPEKFAGMTTAIWGNFYDYSHAFNLYTNDEELIQELEAAIRKNQSSEAYQKLKLKLSERSQGD